MRIISTILCLFALIGCGGGGSPADVVNQLTQPLTSDSKLAIVIKRYAYTTCKETCISDERVERTYTNLDTGEQEVYLECELDYREWKCIDLYKVDKDGKNVVYNISPQDWQQDVAHLFGYYSHEQIKRGIAQVEFLCGQDFVACEDHLEPLQTLKQFIYER